MKSELIAILLLAASFAAAEAPAKKAAKTAAPKAIAEKEAVAEVGKAAPDFTLTGSDGKKHKLSDSKDKLVVLEWLNYDCPFSRNQYEGKAMQTLQLEYGAKGVVWYSIISSAKGKQGNYAPDEINRISAERMARPAAVLLDSDGKVGKLYDAKTTPDMYVIEKGVLRYHGAIDDKPSTDPGDLPKAHNYVRAALDALLAGKPVAVPYTKPYGCSVKY